MTSFLKKFKKNPRLRTLCLLPALLLSLSAIFYISTQMTLYADDYYYSTFLRGGSAEFLRLTADHYLTFNGRALVHFIIHLVLGAGTLLFPLVNTLELIAVFLTGAALSRTDPASAPEQTLLCLSFSLACVTALPAETLRESLFWISASVNYVLPSVFPLLALKIAGRTVGGDGELTPGGRAAAFLLCFVCGATTEQYGAAAIFLTAAAVFLSRDRLSHAPRSRRTAAVLLPVSAFLGWLTVILSPATFGRLVSENPASDNVLSVPLFPDRFVRLSYFFAGEGSGRLLLIVYCLLTAAAAFADRRLPRPLLTGGAAAVLLTISTFFDGHAAVYSLACALSLVYLCYAGALLLRLDEYRTAGLLSICAALVYIMMIFTSSFCYRVTMPSLLLLTVVSAGLFSRCIVLWKKKFRALPILAVCAAAAAGFILILPLMRGYHANRLVADGNLEAVSAYREGEAVYYNIDFDRSCRHLMMQDDGYFNTTYRTCYGLPQDTEIVYVSETLPAIYVGEKKLPYPAVTEGENVYFPVRLVLEALGGTVDYTKDYTFFILGDITAKFDNKALRFVSDGSADRDASTETKKGLYLSFSEEIFTEVLELKVSFDGCYHITA